MAGGNDDDDGQHVQTTSDSSGFHPGTMARLSILDYLHRSVVYSLVGLSIYGIAMGVSAHKHVMQKGRGTNLPS